MSNRIEKKKISTIDEYQFDTEMYSHKVRTFDLGSKKDGKGHSSQLSVIRLNGHQSPK